MKGKINDLNRKTTSILIITILMLSTIAVLMPVTMLSAEPGTVVRPIYFIGTPDWVDNPDVISVEGIALGSHSVELSVDGNEVEIIPPTGIKFSDLADLEAADDWSFWHYNKDDATYGVGLELRFTGPGFDDPKEHIDITVNTAELNPGAGGVWTKEIVTSASTAECYGNDLRGHAPGHFYDGTWGDGVSTGGMTLSQLVTAVNALYDTGETWVGSDPADWELTRVRVEQYRNDIFYIDDITIDGVKYPLENIFLDAEYYHIDSTVTVTILDPELNLLNYRAEIYDWYYDKTVAVDSKGTLDTFCITVTETGVNTSIFVGTFKLVAEDPAQFELVVKSEDTIEVTNDASVLSKTAIVDDLNPSVTTLAPEDGELISDNETSVTAVVDDTNFKLAWMIVDDIPRDSTATAPYTLTYVPLPVDLLAEGLHYVVVRAEDLAGNVNVTSWSFTVDTTEPTCDINWNITKPAVNATDIIEFTFDFDENMTATPLVKIGGNATGYLDPTVPPEVGWKDVRTYSANYTVKSAEFNGTVLITAEDAKDVAGNEMIPANMTFYIDTVAPTAPGKLNATALVNSIVLEWIASADLGSGVELYDIIRNETKVGSVNHPIVTFTDTTILESGIYFYVLKAYDFAGNFATSDDANATIIAAPVTSYNISLAVGWNLVSLPLIPDDSSIEVVLAEVLENVEIVHSYEAGAWFNYLAAASEFATLTDMEDGLGYWVKMTVADTLTVSGVVLPGPGVLPPVYDVYEGWNLIGFKSVSDRTVLEYFTTIPVDVTAHMVVYGWDATSQAYEIVCTGTPVDELFHPGEGYWLYLLEDAVIVP